MIQTHQIGMNSPTFGVNESPKKLVDLCRMCASPCIRPVPIYGEEGRANGLAVKFCAHLPVKVSETDEIPLQLCYDCTNLLIQWDAAVLVAIAADKKLRALQFREKWSHFLSKSESQANVLSQGGSDQQGMHSGETLSCSICKRGGMEFRDLVHHLKGHEKPALLSEEEEKKGKINRLRTRQVNPEFTEDSMLSMLSKDQNSGVEHQGSPKETRSKRKVTLNKRRESESALDEVKERVRLERKKVGKTSINAVEGGADDAVVTSSTSSSSKSIKDTEGEERVSIINNNSPKGTLEAQPFKPKVRIISAESINQSLEERAKALQTAKTLESRSTNILAPPPAIGTSSSSSGLSKLPNRLILPRGVFNVDSNKPAPRYLKLPDGRIIRLLEMKSSPATGKTIVYATNPKHCSIPPAVLNQFGIKKAASSEVQTQEKESTLPGSNVSSDVSTAPLTDVPIVSPPSENISSLDEGSVKKKVVMSESSEVTFNLQPGPKNSISRYTCELCGKRNLQEDALDEHAHGHSLNNTNGEQLPVRIKEEKEDL